MRRRCSALTVIGTQLRCAGLRHIRQPTPKQPDQEPVAVGGRSHAPQAERGLRFDDPDLGLDWPLPVSVISAKDAGWPLLADRDPTELAGMPAGAGARG